MTDIVNEIAIKSASLPSDLQHEVLDFVDFLSTKDRPVKTAPFKSVRGILNRDLTNLEEDLADVRHEIWANFPREEPK
jgi:hypothetical protein